MLSAYLMQYECYYEHTPLFNKIYITSKFYMVQRHTETKHFCSGWTKLIFQSSLEKKTHLLKVTKNKL